MWQVIYRSVLTAMLSYPKASYRENMRGVQEFLKDSFHGMIDYISIVSTPVEGVPIGIDDKSRHIRHVTSDLRQRTRTMAVLNRESIPALPHLLDVPRHLACISSAVIRNLKESTAMERHDDAVDIAIDELCAKCFEVEEEVFSRASRIATMVSSTFTKDPSILDLPPKRYDEVLPSTPAYGIPVMPSDGQGQKRPDFQPTTARSFVGIEKHRQKSGDEQDEYTSTERTFPVTYFQGQQQWNIHTKSPSTDSLPRMVREVRTPAYLPPPTIDKEEDTRKRIKELFRGILKR
jgi:hypothetical protein